MGINDIKSGMLVRMYDNQLYLAVTFKEKLFCNSQRALKRENYLDCGGIINHKYSVKGCQSYNIKEIYSSLEGTTINNYLSLDTFGRTLLWKEFPKETIQIGEAVYDKAEFENAVKDLKPINKL